MHSDINQIKKIKSDFKYFIIFLDNYIKVLKIKLFRIKDEVFNVFPRYFIRNKRGDIRYYKLRTN